MTAARVGVVASCLLFAIAVSARAADPPAAAPTTAPTLATLAELREKADTAKTLLAEVNEALGRVSIVGKAIAMPDEASTQPASQIVESVKPLNGLKTRYQFYLDDLRRQIREGEARHVAEIFAGEVDVYLSVESLASGSPSIAVARFVDTVELAGKTYVRLRTGSRVWSIEPTRIVAVRSTPPRGDGAAGR